MTTKELKIMIIDNFIDHIERDDAKRELLQEQNRLYVEQDHVDEIAQAGYKVTEEPQCLMVNGVIKGIFSSEQSAQDFAYKHSIGSFQIHEISLWFNTDWED